MNLNFLAFYTDHLLVLSLAIVLLTGLLKKISAIQTFFIIFTAVITWLAGMGIKALFWLPRPYLVSGSLPRIDQLQDGSFPSNHALFAFSLCFSMLLFNRKVGLLLFGIAVLVSIGRVLAGVHTPLDVSGAFVLAFFLVFIFRQLIYPKLLG